MKLTNLFRRLTLSKHHSNEANQHGRGQRQTFPRCSILSENQNSSQNNFNYKFNYFRSNYFLAAWNQIGSFERLLLAHGAGSIRKVLEKFRNTLTAADFPCLRQLKQFERRRAMPRHTHDVVNWNARNLDQSKTPPPRRIFYHAINIFSIPPTALCATLIRRLIAGKLQKRSRCKLID